MLSTIGAKRPYPGLRPFKREEAEVFFGRDAHVDRLLEILQRERFLAVIGPSGCGKSSLVRAGLLPALAAGYVGTGSDWRIVVMRPGDRPMKALARELLTDDAFGPEMGAAEEEERAFAQDFIEAELSRGPRGLIDVWRMAAVRVADRRRLNLLVLVDQFEELFTYAKPGDPPSDESEDFVNLLLESRKEREERDVRIYVVLTMRTDFLGHCVRFLELPDAINRAQYLTPRLRREEMREAIVGPANLFGGSIEDRLVGQLLNGIGGQSDQLPILQHALSRMWKRAGGRQPMVITTTDLQEVGGLEDALSNHADAIYEGLPKRERTLAEGLFRFITGRTSPEDGSRDVRRPRSLKEIADAIEGSQSQELVRIVEAFAAEDVNFLTYDGPLEAETIIDISHEALIRKWKRLKGWVDDEATRAAEYRSWRERVRNKSALLYDVDLARALRWRAGEDGRTPTAAWASRYGSKREFAEEEFEKTLRYIARSDRQQEEVERRKREEKERKLEELAANARRRRTISLVAAVMVAVIMVVAGIELQRSSRERDNALRARARQLMSYSDYFAASDPERSQLLAVESYKTYDLPETEGLIREVQSRSAGILPHVKSAVFSPDGRTVLTSDDDGWARLRDAASGRELMTFPHAKVNGAAFSPDGRIVVTAGEDGLARLWDVQSGHEHTPALDHDGVAVTQAAFSADGRRILTTAGGEVVRMWDAVSHLRLQILPAMQAPDAVSSPDGTLVATTALRQAPTVWDVESGRQQPLSTNQDEAPRLTNHAAFSADGQKIVTSSDDGTASVWDVKTLALIKPLVGHQGKVLHAEFSPDGTRVVTASEDQTAAIWDASSGLRLEILPGHAGAVPQASFRADGKSVLTISEDGKVRLWDAAEGKLLVTLDGRQGPLEHAEFSRDGMHLLTIAENGTARRWPASRLTFSGDEDGAFSLDGTLLVTGGRDQRGRLWNLATGHLEATLDGHREQILHVGFSPDSKTIVTTSKDGTARLYDLAGHGRQVGGVADWPVEDAAFSRDGRTIVSVAGGTARLSNVSDGHTVLLREEAKIEHAELSPDGHRIITAGSNGKVRLWSPSGRPGISLKGHDSIVRDAEFSADGKRFVTASEDRTAMVWDATTGARLVPLLGHQEAVRHASFNADGQRVLTASDDKTARLWDAQTGSELTHVAHDDRVGFAVLSPDGKTILTASEDGTARLWDAATGRALATLYTGKAVRFAAFHPGGTTVMTAGAGGVQLWNIAPFVEPIQQMVGEIRRRAGRELTPDERRQSGLD